MTTADNTIQTELPGASAMPSKKITRLTPGQEALLPAIRDEWLAHGLSTAPADRAAAEAGIAAAYRAGGLEPPRFIIWLGSPWAGAWGQAIAPDIIATALRCQRAQAGGQVDAQVRGQVDAQVRDQVDDQVRDQVDGQVRGQADAQVYAQVDAQVRDQVYDQVRGQVDAQVRGQVRGQVYGQADGQVDDQVDAQVDAQVDDQVYAQVRGQVRGQVYAQVRDQVDAQVRDQVYDQVRDQVDDQVRGQADGQVDDQVDAQVDDQVDAQVYAQVRGQVGGQVYAQVRDQVDAQVRAQVQGRLRNWYTGRMLGQHWAGYYSWLDAHAQIGVTGLEPIRGQQQVARSAGWWWAFRHFAIVTDRPAELHRDPLGRLHSGSGMAIRYRDGWGCHAWHGRRVPAWVIEKPTAEAIAEEQNVEVRRCAIESLGWDRFADEGGLVPVGRRSSELCDARVADPGNPGQHLVLYDVPERLWGSRIRLLMCTNGSAERDGTRRRYGLTVPAHIKDPVEAAAWTAGLTAQEYARMQRRT